MTRPTTKKRTLKLESLERRELMAADAYLYGDDLMVVGTSDAEQIQVEEVTVETSYEQRLFVPTGYRSGVFGWALTGYWTTQTVTEEQQKLEVSVADQFGNTLLETQFDPEDVDRVVVNAYGGNDEVRNNTAIPSRLNGGSGNDLLIGGTAADEVYAGYGDDTVYGRAGDDRLYGYSGADFLHGGAGNDYLSGGYQDDVMWGGSGEDTMHGSAGDDTMYGDGWNPNELYEVGEAPWENDPYFLEDDGPDGDDTMYGGAGNDGLFGTGGEDELWGGTGIDSLYGGADDDVLVTGDDAEMDFAVGGWEGGDKSGDHDEYYFNAFDLIIIDDNDDIAMFGGSIINKAWTIGDGPLAGMWYFQEM